MKHRAWLTFLILIAIPACLAAQEPERTRVDRAMAFLAAHNTGDADAFGAFLRENHVIQDPGSDAWREAYLKRWTRFGRLEDMTIEFRESGILEIVAAAAHGQTVTLLFHFEDTEPFRILTLELEIGGGMPKLDLPDLEVAPGASDTEFADAVDAWLSDLAARDLYSGAALVKRNGRVVYRGAHGPASRSFPVPNRIDTRFRIGSITKWFTKVALARLVIEGKIRLTDSIADHLPDYPNPGVASRITVEQLVAHRSGLGDLGPRKLREHSPLTLRGPADYFDLFAAEPLAFEPGTQERYSNAGYIVLGAILEAASGMSYFDCVRQTVFEPAGMIDSDFLSLDLPHENVAEGYWKCRGRDDPQWCNNAYVLEIDGGPSGGSYSSMDDLLRFDEALRANRLLPPGYTRWILGGAWPNAEEVNADPGPVTAQIGVAGGAEGVNALLASEGTNAVIVLCNLDEPIAEEVGMRIFKKLE